MMKAVEGKFGVLLLKSAALARMRLAAWPKCIYCEFAETCTQARSMRALRVHKFWLSTLQAFRSASAGAQTLAALMRELHFDMLAMHAAVTEFSVRQCRLARLRVRLLFQTKRAGA